MNEPKLRLIETRWNERMQDRGYVYAQQKMIAQFNCGGDWAFYLEGDEVLHERDLEAVRGAMRRHLDDRRVEALVFDYHHFFGSPDWVAVGPGWYRRAPRILRNTIRSYSPDGLFFVVMERNKRGRYPRAALAGATLYHYGHVRSIAAMREKNARVGKYWKHDHPLFQGYAIDPRLLAPFSRRTSGRGARLAGHPGRAALRPRPRLHADRARPEAPPHDGARAPLRLGAVEETLQAGALTENQESRCTHMAACSTSNTCCGVIWARQCVADRQSGMLPSQLHAPPVNE